MGRFVNEMMNNMEGEIAKRGGNVSLALYSGHDSTLVPLAGEGEGCPFIAHAHVV